MIKKTPGFKILIAGGFIVTTVALTLGFTNYNNQKKVNEELKNEISDLKENEALANKNIIDQINTPKETNVNKSQSTSENLSKSIQLQNEYEKADAELNILWESIVSYQADYPDVIQKQKEWIKYKDSKDLATKLQLTKERIDTLNTWFAFQRRIQGQNGYQFAQENPCPSLDW